MCIKKQTNKYAHVYQATQRNKCQTVKTIINREIFLKMIMNDQMIIKASVLKVRRVALGCLPSSETQEQPPDHFCSFNHHFNILVILIILIINNILVILVINIILSASQASHPA